MTEEQVTAFHSTIKVLELYNKRYSKYCQLNSSQPFDPAPYIKQLSEILEGKFFPVPSPDELLGDGALEVDKQSLFYKSLKHCCLESPFIVKLVSTYLTSDSTVLSTLAARLIWNLLTDFEISRSVVNQLVKQNNLLDGSITKLLLEWMSSPEDVGTHNYAAGILSIFIRKKKSTGNGGFIQEIRPLTSTLLESLQQGFSEGAAVCLLRVVPLLPNTEIRRYPPNVMQQMVEVALLCLKSEYRSTLSGALEFFAFVLKFPAFIPVFDHLNGFTLLFKTINTFSSQEGYGNNSHREGGHILLTVSSALKQYFETHLAMKVERPGGTSLIVELTMEQICRFVQSAQQLLLIDPDWPPITKFVELSGVAHLIRLFTFLVDDEIFERNEISTNILSVLAVCTASAVVQKLLCYPTEIRSSAPLPGIKILLCAAEGDFGSDLTIRRAALAIVRHCASAPTHRLVRSMGTNESHQISSSVEVLDQVSRALLNSHGLVVLINFLSTASHVLDTVSLRNLACEVLMGLSRNENTRHTLRNASIFTPEKIQILHLSAESSLQENRHEQIKFQELLFSLQQQIFGRNVAAEFEDLKAKVQKANVVAKTNITYDEKQLLHIIHQYLVFKNLTVSANEILREASLSSSLDLGNAQDGKILQPNRLEEIVSSYLANRHSACNAPKAFPQFDLMVPHKCFKMTSRLTASSNIAARIANRMFHPPYGGIDGAKLDRKFVYSRFRSIQTFKCPEKEFTCCAFSPSEKSIMIGDAGGGLTLFNTNTAVPEESYDCHENYLYNIQLRTTGDFMLTSGLSNPPQSCLWRYNLPSPQKNTLELVHQFDNVEYVEFGNIQNKIIATEEKIATIYDLYTCRQQSCLTPVTSNNYRFNRATFNPTDELILSDGVLWDAKSCRQLHQFTKLSQNLNGRFHPNGNEIVISDQVWDIRTFGLIETVPHLGDCSITFSSTGDIIYAIHLQEYDRQPDKQQFHSSFRTVDALDYSLIAIRDVKRVVSGLCSNKSNNRVAIVENPLISFPDSRNESVVRLYDVGRESDGWKIVSEGSTGSPLHQNDSPLHHDDSSSSTGSFIADV